LIATRHLFSGSIVLAVLMTGCASNVTVDTPTIPVPHIDKLPLDVAIRIPEEFNDFVHEENVLGREKWSIHLGSANAKFFEQLFGYMFENVIVLGPEDDALQYTFDALIEPSIEGFEFSVPNQSKTDDFAVWIRYRMRIFDSAGTSAASWTVSAYGKSQKEGLGGSKSLQRAAVLAMRDAAALILLQMNNATKIAALADGPIDLSHFETSAMVQDESQSAPTSPAGLFAIGGIDSDSE
jgi:hypothetical protein